MTAFGVAMVSGSLVLGVFAGAIAGMLTASLFVILVLGFATNQVATGLALTIFGTGLSGLVGVPLIGKTIDSLRRSACRCCPVCRWLASLSSCMT